MKAVGKLMSPYGVEVEAFSDPAMPDQYFFSIDGTMTVAGIYGFADRERCRAAMKAAAPAELVDVALRHGGRIVQRIPLPPPRTFAFRGLPKHAGIPIDNWIDHVADKPDWILRAPAILRLIGGQIDAAKGWSAPTVVLTLAIQKMLTATLEHVGDTEIADLQQAAIYAMTEHKEWRDAAAAWLEPHRKTWFADWRKRQPVYQQFATMLLDLVDTPPWLAGDAA